MSTAIQKADGGGRAALIVADALTQESEQRKLLGLYVKQHMVEGTDYGVIPGTEKPTLLKPGAEKLTQLFRTVPRYFVEKQIEDWDRGLFYYYVRCEVRNGEGAVVAEGIGSANSREAEWRWRNADRKCPACGRAAIIRGKAEYGGGWLCFSKKGGCGAKYPDDAPEITGQPVGRVENPDIFDQVNTIQKIAKKRALVDAAIALARCSDIFTQDIDDVGPVEAEAAPAPEPPKPVPAAKDPRRDALSEAMKAAGWTWARAMSWLSEAYPQEAVKYTPKARFADVEPERVDHLTRHLNTVAVQGA